MDEFKLIDQVVATLGARAAGEWVRLGPGDDAAVVVATPAHDQVASIDTLVAGVHFPVDAPGYIVGYRAIMISVSDLAAMAARPRYALVAMTIPSLDEAWVRDCAAGMRDAAEVCDLYVCGGNFSRGPLCITVSVHGEAPHESAITRAGAQVGHGLYVSGSLGGAAACVRQAKFDFSDVLSPIQQRYVYPQARVDLVDALRGVASAAIDLSDGLLQDLSHLCRASSLQARISSSLVPVFDGANLTDALSGGDDYELLIASPCQIPGFVQIGECHAGSGIYVDDELVQPAGYDHFDA